MKGLIIEKLKQLDKREFSLYNIIYSHFKWYWSVIGIILMLIGFVLFGCFIIPFDFSNWGYLMFSVAFLVGALWYIRKKTLLVLKTEYNKKYNLNITNNWPIESLQIIRLAIFKKRIKKIGVTNSEQLKAALKYFEYDSNSKRYNYTFSLTIIVLILGALLSSFIGAVLGKTNDLSELSKITNMFFGISIMIIFLIFYLDKFIFKEIKLKFRNRNARLIEIIYNYLVEDCAN